MPRTTPAVGERAPDFHLPSSAQESLGLGDFADKWLVLYFYSKDNTSG